MLEQDVHTLQVQCAIPSCGQGPGEILEVPDATNFADARMRIQCRFDITVTTKDVLCTAHWASFNRAPRNIKCCDQGRVLLPILGGAQPKRHLWAPPANRMHHRFYYLTTCWFCARTYFTMEFTKHAFKIFNGYIICCTLCCQRERTQISRPVHAFGGLLMVTLRATLGGFAVPFWGPPGAEFRAPLSKSGGAWYPWHLPKTRPWL